MHLFGEQHPHMLSTVFQKPDRDLWNCFFPHEKLQCKDYGYRDVKGLLANIPVVEKVGGKNSTKYVLKSEARRAAA